MNKSMKLLLPLLTTALLGGSPSIVSAEQIMIPVSKQSPELKEIPRPANGTTMQDVEAEYGTPLSKTDAVGKPPIATWEYELFKVYFERSLVIHTVLKHNPQ